MKHAPIISYFVHIAWATAFAFGAALIQHWHLAETVTTSRVSALVAPGIVGVVFGALIAHLSLQARRSRLALAELHAGADSASDQPRARATGGFSRRERSRIYALYVGASMLAVSVFATTQFTFILHMSLVDLHPVVYMVPLTVGGIFGLLLANNHLMQRAIERQIRLIAERGVRLQREIEERRKMEATLRHRGAELTAANQELEAFTYSASHDLRAPLRRIDGFSAILAEDYGAMLGAEGRAVLARVRGAIEHMERLLDSLLELSRVTRSALNPRNVDLSDIASQAVAELSAEAPERKVETTIAAGLTAYADPGLLRVALTNLIGNAWKFTALQTPARIEVGMLEREQDRIFFVRDNGVGFDGAMVERIFQPFQRLHSEDKFQGTGIGLATVQRVVQRHGGRIWAQGEIDQGATFFFTLNDLPPPST